MPLARTDDGIGLYFEATGSGTPIVFVHEFAGDCGNWEPQLRHFGQRYRAIAFNARGYPPSDVPEDVSFYSQDRAADDIAAVLDHLALARAHIVGLSMGGFAALHFGFRHPQRAISLVVAGCGYGAHPDERAAFRAQADAAVTLIRREGMAAFAESYLSGPTRVQYASKDPRGFAAFKAQLARHSAVGSANTQLGCLKERPSLYDLTDRMRALAVPTLVLTGDEDWPCLEPAMLMKKNIPRAALAVLPNCGHGIGLEDPDVFNRAVGDFINHVQSGRWPGRDQAPPPA